MIFFLLKMFTKVNKETKHSTTKKRGDEKSESRNNDASRGRKDNT